VSSVGGTVQKFSSGGSGFDPSFSKAERSGLWVSIRSDSAVE